MQDLENTQYFKVEVEPENGVKMILSEVYEALMSIFLKTFPFWTGKRTKSILPENSVDFVLSIINPCISLFIKIIKTARFFR